MSFTCHATSFINSRHRDAQLDLVIDLIKTRFFQDGRQDVRFGTP